MIERRVRDLEAALEEQSDILKAQLAQQERAQTEAALRHSVKLQALGEQAKLSEAASFQQAEEFANLQRRTKELEFALAQQSDKLCDAEKRADREAALRSSQMQEMEGRALQAEAALAQQSNDLHDAEKREREAAALQAMQELEGRASRAEAALAHQMDQLREKEQSSAQLWRSLDGAQAELKKWRIHNDKLQQRLDAANRELRHCKSEAWAHAGSDCETCSTSPGSTTASLLDGD